jgi:hypothetical protein
LIRQFDNTFSGNVINKKVDFAYDIEKHEQFFFDQMDERGKRLYLGLEAMKLGYNGVAEVSYKYILYSSIN